MKRVALWWIEHDGLAPEERSALLDACTPDERTRYENFAIGARADSFLIGRRGLRTQLLQLWDLPKPRLTCQRGAAPAVRARNEIKASLAHERNITAVVTAVCDVGVDVTRVTSCPQVIERLFAEGEQDWLRGIDDNDRPAARAKAWAIKEACSKVDGEGLFPLPRLRTPLTEHGRVGERLWSTYELWDGSVAALATCGDVGVEDRRLSVRDLI